MWLEVIVLNCAGLYLDLFHYLLKEEDFETQKPRKNVFFFSFAFCYTPFPKQWAQTSLGGSDCDAEGVLVWVIREERP